MGKLMDFSKWAEKWWQENDKTKDKVTTSDIDFLGLRLRKAIDAVFGFEDCKKVESMYDNVEINDIFPDMVMPLNQEDEKNNRSVLAAVQKMSEEEWPEKERPSYYTEKVARIKTLEKAKEATTNHLAKLAKAAPNDVKASEKRERANGAIEAKEDEIKNLKAKLVKVPFGKEPIFEKVGEMEGELFDFLLKNIGRGGSVTPYSYVDIQRGYWEKVDINDRKVLFKLVRELCEKKGWHISFGFGDFLNNQFDLEEFSQKIYLPQIYRCKVKADILSGCFANMTDIELLEGNDQFLSELHIFMDIDKKLDKLLEKTETIYSPFIDRYIESKTEDFISKDNQ